MVLGTPFIFGQSTTRLNPTNAAPVSMDNDARVIWISPSDPNFLFKASPFTDVSYTKSQTDATFMKTNVAEDSINAMKNTISANQAATNDKFNDYYTKIESDAKYVIPSALTWSNISGKPSFSSVATTGSYNDLSNKPNIPSVNNASVIAALGYTPLQFEVDGSTTNEIELPSQTGQNGKFLTTNGTTASWAVSTTAGAYGSTTLPLLAVGNYTASVTFNTAMPNTNYAVVVDLQGNSTLLGALVYQGVLTKTTTGCTLQLRNTGLVSLAAGGVVTVTAIGIQ